MQLKGPQRQKETQEQNKNEWASSVGLYRKHKPQHPHHVKVSPRGQIRRIHPTYCQATGKKTQCRLWSSVACITNAAESRLSKTGFGCCSLDFSWLSPCSFPSPCIADIWSDALSRTASLQIPFSPTLAFLVWIYCSVGIIHGAGDAVDRATSFLHASKL